MRTAFQGPGNISPVGHAAHLMVDLTIPNFGIQESTHFGERTLEVFRGTPELRDGYMWPNEKPGLGIDIDEELALKFPHDPHAGGQFDNVRRADGTVVTP